MKEKQATTTLSRRRFLTAAGGITFVVAAGAMVPITRRDTDVPAGVDNGNDITAWVQVRPDGKIRLFSPAAEMGQGSMTALGIIIAEEMDAAWEDVEIHHSPIEPDTYGLQWGGKLGGPMLTVGSRTVRGYYRSLRHAGAQARYAMMAMASAMSGKPQDELSTSPSKVHHKPSGSAWTYGEIAAKGSTAITLPEIPETKWKKPSEFRLIGHARPRVDIPAKVDGSALFAMDIQVPGMVYAGMNRAPVHGAKAQLQNEEAVRNTPGFVDLVHLDHGIAVVCDSAEEMLAAKKLMKISWSKDAKAQGYDSIAAFDRYAEVCAGGKTGNVIHQTGNVSSAMSQASQSFKSLYRNDFAYHAQMEPLNAVVSVAADGKSAEAWVGSQSTDGARRTVAKTLGIDFDQVILHPCYLGGGFGRRSMSDYVEEATIISRETGQPVKLIWTRQDDLQYGAFRPMSVQQMEASTDDRGKIQAWRHTIAGTGGGLMTSGVGISYYDIPNQHIERRNTDEGVRTKHWRSVGHGPNKYAIEAFIDEICRTYEKDPYQYRLDLLAKNPREQQVVRTVGEMCDWGAPVSAGRARGLAFGERSGALVAGVAEISLEDGTIRVHHFWCAMDAGVVVDPGNATAQLEGGVIFGLSSVLKESLTFADGAVKQSNFHDYQLLRISEAPETIDLKIIASQEAPAGIGEASLPVVGGAVANAFLALTGKPLYHMPFTPARVREALA